MIDYIKYKGEELPVRIEYSSFKRMKSENSWDDLETALWYGLISGHRAENKELKVTKDDIEFILDESLADFIVIFNKSTELFKSLLTQGSEDKKK